MGMKSVLLIIYFQQHSQSEDMLENTLFVTQAPSMISTL